MDNRQKVNANLRDEAFSKLSKIERRLVASYIEGVIACAELHHLVLQPNTSS